MEAISEVKTLGLIVGRAGSKRLPGKHLLLLGDKPLLAWTLEAALGAKSLKKIIISTDSQEMMDMAAAYGVEAPFSRPDELSGDFASPLDVVRHAVHFCKERGEVFDTVVLLQPTSPFRTSRHIDESVEIHYQTGADTTTSVCPAREHAYYQGEVRNNEFIPFNPDKYNQPRQELPLAFIENGSIYVLSVTDIDLNRFYGEKVAAYCMDEFYSVDIDTRHDFNYAKFLLQRSELLKGGRGK